jgi:hypothetical protein
MNRIIGALLGVALVILGAIWIARAIFGERDELVALAPADGAELADGGE